MFDPGRYDDGVILKTSEVVAWTGLTRRSLVGLPGLKSLDQIKARERCYLAGDVKDAMLGDRRGRSRPTLMRRMG